MDNKEITRMIVERMRAIDETIEKVAPPTALNVHTKLDWDKMMNHVTALEAQAAEMEGRIKSYFVELQIDVDAIERRITALEKTADTLIDKLGPALSHITTLESRVDMMRTRITALEHPPYPDDVRDALRDLDELGGAEPTPAPRLWKLNNFPADRDGIACWPPFDPDKPDQTLFMWRVDDEDDE